MKKYAQLFKMVFTLVLIATISAYVLGKVEQLTRGEIEKVKDARELDAVAEVVDEFDNNPFEEKMIIRTTDRKDKLELFPARKGDKINSVAIKTYSNNGFGGKIELMLGIHVDGSIINYKVIEHKETPGLGTKVEEEKFKQQFYGYNPNKGGFRVKQDGGDIDAVTAATISSRAIINAIDRAYDAYNNFISGN